MRVFGLIGCVGGDDRYRVENISHLISSVVNQRDEGGGGILDGIFLSGHFGDDNAVTMNGFMKEAFASNIDSRMLFFQNCKQPLGRFWQLFLLINKHKDKLDGTKDWFLCSDDDGIWHPRRTAMYRDAINKMGRDVDVTCVGFASKTEYIGKDRRLITCPEQVQMAMDEKQIQIVPWIYQTSSEEDKDRNVEFYDLCVRADVVLDFFKVTPEHVLRNSHCDVAFCDFVTSYPGKRSLFIQNNQWNYFWRRAEPGYDTRYVTSLQFSSMEHKIKDIYQMCGDYICRVAEMSVVPCLETTAQLIYDGIAETLEPGERAMLMYHYQEAQKKYGDGLKKK